ncbi:hypothetical protein MUN89_15780 [Halobacillus salinarum]|uniref:NfeD-like C-terminal domain-containing protein n=1 Tax=Halobacillus salinarum TaxID=2932257 RepID=A0ABY4EH97_9BACI|nr:hypothetical protein [Halobacillus salinarum]UOQ43370.1 hypothetical protein MUN89_15780 [Halobacillus salinarum]
MEQFLDFVKQYNWIGVLVSVLIFVRKMYPITSLTADVVEEKLFSKEKRIVLDITKFLVQSIYWAFVLLSINLFLEGTMLGDINTLWGAIFSIFGGILFFYFFFDVELNWNSSKKLIVPLFIFYIILLVLVGSKFIDMAETTFKDPISLFFGKATLAFIMGLFATRLFKPALLAIQWFENKVIVSYKEKTEEDCNVWFVFHPINKDHILVGDSESLNECKKKKIILKDKIIDKQLIIEKIR